MKTLNIQTQLRFRATLAIALMTIFSSASFKTWAGPEGNIIFLQVPSHNANRPVIFQPAVPPASLPKGSWDNVAHLWPRTVSYSMETEAMEYFVNPDLTVGVKYNYSFNFELNARNGRGHSMNVPDGWYQLQLAVIKKDENNGSSSESRYVTSTSIFTRVSNGSFGRKISLRFSDMRSTATKHHLFIELIPLKDECLSKKGKKVPCISVDNEGRPDANNSYLEPKDGYKTYLIEMPFVPFHSSGGKVRDADDLSSQDVSFLGGSLAAYIAKAQIGRFPFPMNSRMQGITPAQHATQNRFHFKNLSHPSINAIAARIGNLLVDTTVGPIDLIENDRSFFASLCRLLIAYNADFQQRHRSMPHRTLRLKVIENHITKCATNPWRFMRLNRVVHVDRVVPGKVENIATRILNYSLMSNQMSVRSQSTDVSTSVGIKPPSLLAKLLDQVGLTAGKSVSYGESRTQAQTGMGSALTPLDLNFFILKMTGTGLQRCLEIRPFKDKYAYFFDHRPDALNGFYICDPKNQKKIEFTEVYAHVFERCKETTIECSAKSQTINVLLRGEGELSGFFYAVRDAITPEQNNRVLPFGAVKGADRYFANIPSTGNMQVITPINLSSDPVPSLLDKVANTYGENFR